MSEFLTPLQVSQELDTSTDNRGTWQLLRPLVYRSDLAKRTFAVPVGFITDFASVPRIPVAFLLTGNSAHAAAVVHDWLYTTHEVDKELADNVFKEACLALGVYGWKAYLMWLGVHLGGEHSWKAAGPRQPEIVRHILNVIAKGA